MSMIRKPVAYKVTLTEYERGWGQKRFDEVYFDSEDEARRYAVEYNRKHNTLQSAPDWYVRAEYVGSM